MPAVIAGPHRLRRLAAALLLACAMGAAAGPATAQVPDTARTPPADTLRPPPDSALVPDPLRTAPDTTGRDTTGRDSLQSDSLRAARVRRGPRPLRDPPLGFDRRPTGTATASARPARTPVLDATDLLASVPGSFLYDLGGIGWPHGWSAEGLRPAAVGLRLDGRPFDDPLTGRPRYDLLPLMLLEPLRAGAAAALGRPHAVAAQTRPYDSPRPLTELRYRRASTGMQGVSAVHTQRRRRALFGRQGVLDALGAYGGRAADNAYPGSRLSTERRLLGRLRYAQDRWAAELSALHNRRTLGAHGGVQTAIFSALQATVRNSGATRRLIRTDLAATARVRWRAPAPADTLRRPPALDPLTASAYRTAQLFRYRPGTPSDTAFVARTDRYGAFVEQTATVGPHRLRLRADAWIDRPGEGNALDTAFTARTRFHLTAADSLALGRVGVTAEGGLHGGSGGLLYASGRLGLRSALGPLRLLAEARRTGLDPSLAEEYGFGPYVRPLGEAGAGTLQDARLGLGLEAGFLDARLTGFARQTESAPDLYALADPDAADPGPNPPADSAAALTTAEPLRRVGATAALGLRRGARLGLYLTAQATAQQVPGAERASADASDLAARQAAAVPEVYGRARLGARLSLFTDDLYLDLYAQGRFWSQMRSRTLHAPTGLLAVPLPSTAPTGPTGVLDLYAEGRIRTATLFLAYENALSGTEAQRGVFVSPIYPLTEQRFRFGVFWPIPN